MHDDAHPTVDPKSDRERLLAELPLAPRRLQVAGVSTAVLEGGQGRPLVLLHGPAGYAAQWMRVLPGLVGTVQATEAIKLILGQGESLVGRLLLIDALDMQFRTLKLRRDPAVPAPRPRRTREEPSDEDEPLAVPPRSRPAVAVAEPARPIAPAAKPNPKKGKGSLAAQASLALGDNYQLPSLDLLAAPPEKGKTQIDRAGLERNARLLESVLEDFHVRGDIVEVRPGPVVTMYELEPASGIKASRVIQLAATSSLRPR